MGRWQPDSRGRLQEAALALYSERGFDQTTAAQIADRAGLTERTFFRHFAADKREVLFGGSALLGERIVAGVVGAPAGDGPLDAVARGLDAAAAMLGEFRRDLSRQRQTVIEANPELRERATKLADYAAAVAVALRQRGVGELQATLAAETGMTVLRVAMQRWAATDNSEDLSTIMRDSVAELRAVAGSG